MVKKIKKIWRPKGLEGLNTSKDVYIQFILKYKEQSIGILTLDNGEWIFEYSLEFQQQDIISILANFPTRDKVYRSKDLWPFFASRIPSNNQLIIKNEKIEKDLATLLKKYGKRTITNPFILTPA